MSMNIDSKLNNENGFWDVSLQGELDVSTADKLKEHLHNLADEKILDMKINLILYRFYGLRCYDRCFKEAKNG